MIDEVLVTRCREGDREAQRELYARTSDRIYRLLLRMTGNPDDALDLAQDTYVKVFSRIDGFQGGSDVATWIYTIALNEARQFIRRGRRREAAVPFSDSIAVVDGTAEADGRLAAWDVREALSRLPDYERSLIVMRHFDGLSYERMAEVLEKPPGTIASALNRARRLLRGLLQNNFDADSEDSASCGHLTE